MNKTFTAVSLVLLLVSAVLAQVPDTLWTKTYGGSNDDSGRSIQVTKDGGCIIVGHTGSVNNDFDVYCIKTDRYGDTLWTRTYGGPDWDTGSSIEQCSDRGYIITGYTKSSGAGSNDVLLIKIDSLGNLEWTKTYGGPNEDGASSVQQTMDGGYIITGETMSFGAQDYDVSIIKTDSVGNLLWLKTIGGSDCDGSQAIIQTYDGGYAIIGDTKSYGRGWHDVYLIKTDIQGDTLWTRTYGGTNFDYGESIQQTKDRGFIIAGWTRSFGSGMTDVYLIKTDRYGDTLWTRAYGGIDHDFGFSVVENYDGGYLIVGDTKSFGSGWYDVYVIKTDRYGDTLWTKTVGGIEPDEGFSIDRTFDGGYIIVGNSRSFGSGNDDVYLIRLEPFEPSDQILRILIWDSTK